jgi:ATP-dependent exoDNAse (exonuclease V) alpha subunit
LKQSTALKILSEGRNVFLTGSAGAGKTYVLNQFIAKMKEENKSIAVTASTGIAATHLEGQTIHAYSGIGIRSSLSDDFFEQFSFKRFKAPNIRSTEILIIDEISMLSDIQFQMVDQVLRKVKRRSKLPFGGVQIVVCGDFFQLPPIGEMRKTANFATETSSWIEADFATCYLTEQHRQNDANYNALLEGIRSGEVPQNQIDRLLTRIIKLTPQNHEQFANNTHLYTHNRNVESYNYNRLGQLETKEYSFHLSSTGPKHAVDALIKGSLASSVFRAKKNALVISIKNDPEGNYVNGSIGNIIGFSEKRGLPIVKFQNGFQTIIEPYEWALHDNLGPIATIEQIPLSLAWAITVHKSQGMTLDQAVIDLRQAFELGMGYVALSRLRTYEDLQLLGINQTALKVSEKALELDKFFRSQSQTLELLYF